MSAIHPDDPPIGMPQYAILHKISSLFSNVFDASSTLSRRIWQVMHALKDIGFTGMIRPDHVPLMEV